MTAEDNFLILQQIMKPHKTRPAELIQRLNKNLAFSDDAYPLLDLVRYIHQHYSNALKEDYVDGLAMILDRHHVKQPVSHHEIGRLLLSSPDLEEIEDKKDSGAFCAGKVARTPSPSVISYDLTACFKNFIEQTSDEAKWSSISTDTAEEVLILCQWAQNEPHITNNHPLMKAGHLVKTQHEGDPRDVGVILLRIYQIGLTNNNNIIIDETLKMMHKIRPMLPNEFITAFDVARTRDLPSLNRQAQKLTLSWSQAPDNIKSSVLHEGVFITLVYLLAAFLNSFAFNNNLLLSLFLSMPLSGYVVMHLKVGMGGDFGFNMRAFRRLFLRDNEQHLIQTAIIGSLSFYCSMLICYYWGINLLTSFFLWGAAGSGGPTVVYACQLMMMNPTTKPPSRYDALKRLIGGKSSEPTSLSLQAQSPHDLERIRSVNHDVVSSKLHTLEAPIDSSHHLMQVKFSGKQPPFAASPQVFEHSQSRDESNLDSEARVALITTMYQELDPEGSFAQCLVDQFNMEEQPEPPQPSFK